MDIFKKLSTIDFDAIGRQATSGFAEVIHALKCLYGEAKQTREAAASSASIHAYEYGLPPRDGQNPERFAPRSLSQLPLIYEAETAERVKLAAETDNQGRVPSRGYVANLGPDAFKVTFYGVAGSARELTIMPGMTLAVTWLCAALDITPGPDGPAAYQVVLQ